MSTRTAFGLAFVLMTMQVAVIVIYATGRLDWALCFADTPTKWLPSGAQVLGELWSDPRGYGLGLAMAVPAAAALVSKRSWMLFVVASMTALPPFLIAALSQYEGRHHHCDRKGCTTCEAIGILSIPQATLALFIAGVFLGIVLGKLASSLSRPPPA